MFNGYKSKTGYQGPRYLNKLATDANKGNDISDIDDLKVAGNDESVTNNEEQINTCLANKIGAVRNVSGSVEVVDENYLLKTNIDEELKKDYPELYKAKK